jgi:septal ring factor EnvC (AmiA/AmiB activator)
MQSEATTTCEHDCVPLTGTLTIEASLRDILYMTAHRLGWVRKPLSFPINCDCNELDDVRAELSNTTATLEHFQHKLDSTEEELRDSKKAFEDLTHQFESITEDTNSAFKALKDLTNELEETLLRNDELKQQVVELQRKRKFSEEEEDDPAAKFHKAR